MGGFRLRLFNHAAGFRVSLLDVLLQHGLFDTPLAPASDLDGLQFAASHEGIGLRRVDLQLFGDVCKGEESGHDTILPLPGMSWSGYPQFGVIWTS